MNKKEAIREAFHRHEEAQRAADVAADTAEKAQAELDAANALPDDAAPAAEETTEPETETEEPAE